MSSFKPEQSRSAQLIGGFNVDTTFSANEDFIKNLMKLYDQACDYHIRSAISAVSDKDFERQAAFDLGVKEAIYSVLQLMPSTDPYQGASPALDVDEMLDHLREIRNDLYLG